MLTIKTKCVTLNYTCVSKIRKYYQPSNKKHYLLVYNLNNVMILKIDLDMIDEYY